jgi:hypothetical protein
MILHTNKNKLFDKKNMIYSQKIQIKQIKFCICWITFIGFDYQVTYIKNRHCTYFFFLE